MSIRYKNLLSLNGIKPTEQIYYVLQFQKKLSKLHKSNSIQVSKNNSDIYFFRKNNWAKHILVIVNARTKKFKVFKRSRRCVCGAVYKMCLNRMQITITTNPKKVPITKFCVYSLKSWRIRAKNENNISILTLCIFFGLDFWKDQVRNSLFLYFRILSVNRKSEKVEKRDTSLKLNKYTKIFLFGFLYLLCFNFYIFIARCVQNYGRTTYIKYKRPINSTSLLYFWSEIVLL